MTRVDFFATILCIISCLSCIWSDQELINELQRDKRQVPQTTTAAPEPPADLFILQKNSLLMVFRSVSLTVGQMEAHNLVQHATYTTANGTVTANGTDMLDAVLNFGRPQKPGGFDINTFDLSMSFIKGMGGYWAMTEASVNLTGSETSSFTFTNIPLISSISLVAPEDLSFHCSRFGPLVPGLVKPINNHTFSIDLYGFQIQPFSTNTSSFAPAYECVGFFTIGILSGIFITLILISVLTWGMAMIMNVKTMDRFDDPKGKPVSFGGTD